MATHILVVDDETAIADLVEVYLKNEGFTIHKFYNASDALACVRTTRLNLAVLDVMLPDMDGFTLCQRIREDHLFPIIMLTAKVEDMDKIMGLTLGADDYIVKPFRPKELELRILSILKRAYPEKDDTLILPTCQVNFSQALITKGELEIQLTAKEYSILKVLFNNQNRIVTFDQLLEKVWGLQYQGYENSMMAHIRKIRQKIEANPSKPECLLSGKGLGFYV